MTTAAQASIRAGTAACPRDRVGVTRLVLTDFRNYGDARLDLDPGPVVLTGANGAGKTNLLEAVSFLAPGRGLRGARLGEIDRRTASGQSPGSGWAVAATIATRRGPVRIGTGRACPARDGAVTASKQAASSAAERRVVRIDGDTARGQIALGERLGLVWLTPAMDRIFLEGPAGRRRLLDRLVLGLDPAHAGRVAAYEHALRERSRLLRDGLSFGRPADPVWLAALEEVMAEKGVAVAAARRELVQRLDRVCAEAEGPFPRARLSLLGTVAGWLETMPALAAEERTKQALSDNRREDAASGSTALGPHRSDLAVVFAAKGISAETASTGEQKALLIAILLAHARLQHQVRGEAPVLLLDEVAAHLDPSRRGALFETLRGLDSQAWLTGTDAAVFSPLRPVARFLSVTDGNLADTAF
ncbi:MAG: DNA replication/repair protein RecF [Alphaproteobacteria bacterium]|nr:DNA replication/repair protein RecF [Alphaproteobacteria bacterium]